MFKKLLIANRGEIAVRIMRTAKRLGIQTVAVYSDGDVSALHVEVADEAWGIGPPDAAQSYLDQAAIIAAAKKSGAEAIHPGYGFLAENPDFAEAVQSAGLIFVGPGPAAMRTMGLKHEAKRLMQKASVPLLPSYHGAKQDIAALAREAEKLDYPVLIKPVAGGGGKGMRRVNSAADLMNEVEASQREAISAFGDGRLLLEKFIATARHIEVQIMADSHGNVVHLFERDCSLQRRHQKVIEETPAPGMTDAMRKKLCAAAVAAAQSVGYVGAGTVEFLADVSDGLRPDRFYFMEMNTRLQVEHPVTELVTGLDLVELQLRVAAGETLPISQDNVRLNGHAVEARLYAEDPARNFQPQSGRVARFSFPSPSYLRIDSGVRAGDAMPPYYDPLMAKLIVHAPSRGEALARLAGVLAEAEVTGLLTNLAFLNRLMCHPAVVAGQIDTSLIGRNLDGLLQAATPPIDAVAVALLFAFGHLSPPSSASPFDTLTGFRLWGGEPMRQTFTSGGEQTEGWLEREGEHFIARSNGKSRRFRLLSTAGKTLRLDCGDRVEVLSFFKRDGALAVVWRNERYEFGLVDEAIEAAANEGSGLVLSPMPGKLRKLNVAVDQHIKRGAILAIIEAMKMELSLKAERDGQIREIHAKEGTQVSEGEVLMKIEAGDA